jgi:hypothetical protein
VHQRLQHDIDVARVACVDQPDGANVEWHMHVDVIVDFDVVELVDRRQCDQRQCKWYDLIYVYCVWAVAIMLST